MLSYALFPKVATDFFEKRGKTANTQNEVKKDTIREIFVQDVSL